MPKFRYLSKEVLKGFDHYKYSSVDTSPLSKYICHPFWNWVVKFYPRWLAPNLMTLVGFMLLVAIFAVLSYYDPVFYAATADRRDYSPIPNWVWLFCAGSNFVSHTLDGTDGKQARQTGSSSPLGELFDHGLDSWATVFYPMALYSIYGRGEFGASVAQVYFIIMAVQMVFIMSHWEKYNTNIMFLPWGYDISQVSMSLVHLITFIGGYEMWRNRVPVIDWSAAEVFQLSVYLGSVALSFPMTAWNIYKAYRDKTGKMRSLYETMLPLLSSVALFTASTVWLFMSKYDIVEKDPRLFYFAIGTTFSNITCRLIVSQMSSTRCEVFNWLLIPLVAVVSAAVIFNLGIYEYYLLWTYTVLVTAAHLHYGVCVVQEMAEHFDINAFSIKEKLENGKGDEVSNHVSSNGKKIH